MTGTFEYEKGDKRPVPDFNVFFRYIATYPVLLAMRSGILTQMRRWGQIPEAKPDSWYIKIAKEVYRPGHLRERGQGTDRRGQGEEGRTFRGTPGRLQGDRKTAFIDGVGVRWPQAERYIDKFKIGLKGDNA